MKVFRLLVFLIAFLMTGSAIGSGPYSVKYLGIDQGLSNNAVNCIYQDYNGFMWFGTYDGVNKYDGYSFQVFRNIIGDATSLTDNHIFSIDGDASRNIWIGGMNGVSVYNPVKSIFYHPRYICVHTSENVDIKDQVHVVRHVQNMMFIGTQSNGLIVFKKGNMIGKQIAIISSRSKEDNYTVSAINYDSVRRQVWVFVNNVGLCKYNDSNGQLILVSPALLQANCLLVKQDGNILIGNDSGLYTFAVKNTDLSTNMLPSKVNVTSITEDKQHTLWIASDGSGLWLMPRGAARPAAYSASDGDAVNSNAIYDIYEDTYGRKWIGTLRGGINVLESKINPFRIISFSNTKQGGIINDFILSFCEDEKSNVWIGTDGAGLRYWNKRANTFEKFTHNTDNNSVSSNFITNITKDYQNEIWIST